MNLFSKSIKYILALSAIFVTDTVNGQFPACNTGTFEQTTALGNNPTFFSELTIYDLLCQSFTSNAAPLEPAQFFTEFCNSIRRFPDLVNLLANNSTGTTGTTGTKYTVFAPVDSAFLAITNILGNLTPNQLRRVLELHIYDGAHPLSELNCGKVMNSLNTGGGLQGGRSRTKCSDHAGVGGQFQIGPCNALTPAKIPRIGSPDGSNPPFVFQKTITTTETVDFTNAEAVQGGYGPEGQLLPNVFNVNAPTCNGLIHALSQVMLPANTPGCNVGFENPVPGKGVSRVPPAQAQVTGFVGSKGGKGFSGKSAKNSKGGGQVVQVVSGNTQTVEVFGPNGFPVETVTFNNNPNTAYYTAGSSLLQNSGFNPQAGFNANTGTYQVYNYGNRRRDLDADVENKESDELSAAAAERSNRRERRKRVLESLVEANGDIAEN